MKPFIRLLVLVSIIPWIACTKEATPPDPPTPPVTDPEIKLLTLTVDASYSTSATDNWVLVHDINGKMLGYQSFETGDSVLIKKSGEIADNKINITLIRFDTNFKYLNLQSYLYNNVGQEWTLSMPVYPPVTSKIGQFQVNVASVPAESSYQFSNKNHILFGTAHWSLGGLLEQTLDLHANAPDCFFHLTDDRGVPKYLLLQNIQSGQQYNLSANLLKDFDKTVGVSFPPTLSRKILYTVNNVQPGQPNPKSGYILNGNLSNTYISNTETRSSVILGYLDSYTNYFTTMSVEYGSTLKYFYERLGTKPDKIELPLKDSFLLTDKNIFQFRFQNNKPFVQRNSYWMYKEAGGTLSWQFCAPYGATQLYPDIPAELTAKFPSLLPDKLQHEATLFTVQGESYGDMIDFTFKKKPRGTSYENYRIEVR
jgi:hypothetical protein